MADVVRDDIVIKSDPDSIMDVIADFEAYPQWQDEIKEVEILDTDADGWATRVRFRVDAMITEVNYVLKYDYTDSQMTWSMVEADKLRSNEGAYTLEDQGDATTLVRYELQVEPAIKVPGVIRKQGQRRIVHAALQALKQRVES